MLFKGSESARGQAVMSGVVCGQLALGFASQPERTSDSLHVDPEHAGSLAAAERGDRESREVSQS